MVESEIKGQAGERRDTTEYEKGEPLAALVGAGKEAERQVMKLRQQRHHPGGRARVLGPGGAEGSKQVRNQRTVQLV